MPGVGYRRAGYRCPKSGLQKRSDRQHPEPSRSASAYEWLNRPFAHVSRWNCSYPIAPVAITRDKAPAAARPLHLSMEDATSRERVPRISASNGLGSLGARPTHRAIGLSLPPAAKTKFNIRVSLVVSLSSIRYGPLATTSALLTALCVTHSSRRPASRFPLAIRALQEGESTSLTSSMNASCSPSGIEASKPLLVVRALSTRPAYLRGRRSNAPNAAP